MGPNHRLTHLNLYTHRYRHQCLHYFQYHLRPCLPTRLDLEGNRQMCLELHHYRHQCLYNQEYCPHLYLKKVKKLIKDQSHRLSHLHLIAHHCRCPCLHYFQFHLHQYLLFHSDLKEKHLLYPEIHHYHHLYQYSLQYCLHQCLAV
jgi:hypothetical protein